VTHGPPIEATHDGETWQRVGDTFLNLPVGKVWRQTLEVVPPKARGGWAARKYWRTYWLDRGVVRDAKTGTEKQFIAVFTVRCRYDQCATHNGQLAAIMRSIRFVS